MRRHFSRLVRAAAAAAFAAAAPVSLAVDGVAVEVGQSDSSNVDVRMARVGLQWKWAKRWFEGNDWHLGGYWDASLGYWDNRSVARDNSGITDLGFTPVFRLQANRISGASPYLEAGIGFHLLSATSVSPQRQFGSSFQFGDHVGGGIRFGDKGQYDVGYKYQHLSNAGIKQPNQGINYHILRLQYRF